MMSQYKPSEPFEAWEQKEKKPIFAKKTLLKPEDLNALNNEFTIIDQNQPSIYPPKKKFLFRDQKDAGPQVSPNKLSNEDIEKRLKDREMKYKLAREKLFGKSDK